MFFNIIKTSGVNIYIMIMNIMTGILLARLLGPTQRGELAAAQTFPSILCGLALLGLPEALVYWLSRDQQSSKQTVVTVLCLFIPITVLTWLLGYFITPYVLRIQSLQVIRNARIYMFTIISMSFGSIYVWGFQGLQKFKYWNLLRMFPALAWFVAIIVGHVLRILSTTYLILFLIVVPLPFMPIFMRIFWNHLNGSVKPNFGVARKLLSYGMPIMLSAIPQSLNLRMDQLIMAAILAPKILGLYVVGVTWSTLASVFFTAVGSILFPKIAQLSDSFGHSPLLGSTARTSVLLANILMLPQLVLTPFIIPLFFGRNYAPAIPAAMVLVVAGVFMGLNIVWRNIINGLGHPEILLYAEILGMIATAIFLLLLLRPYQIMGAALTSLASYAITFSFLSAFVGRYTKLTLKQLVVPTSADFILLAKKIADTMQTVKISGKKMKTPTKPGIKY